MNYSKSIIFNICLYLLFLFSFQILNAQDVEQVLKAKPITVKGGFSMNTGWYFNNDTNIKRDPYTWGINANLNFNLFGIIDVPFTAVYNKQDKAFKRPEYKNIGFSPKYKDYTLHLGYRSLQYSPYTYSGLTFYGIGAEVAPQNSIVKYSAFYGRLNEAIPWNYASSATTDVEYKRWGWGSKISVGKNNQNIDFIIFKAKDDLESIHIHPDSVSTKPEENIVIGINTTNKITKRISLKLELARSYLSSDTRVGEKSEYEHSLINEWGLFSPRMSTSAQNAVSGNINYQGDSYSFGFSYKRIAPEFKTLGASYSANDNQDWLINASKSFLASRLNVGGSIGMQRDNLNNTKLSTSKRTISSLNASYAVTESLNFAINYSNFASNSSSPSIVDFSDSIVFIQTTSNFGLNAAYNFGTDNLKHSLTGSFNIQNANTLNQTSQESINDQTIVKSENLTYSLNFVPLEMTFNSSINYTLFEQDTIVNKSFGPTFGTGRAFFQKKVQTNISVSYLKQENSRYQTGAVTIINLSIGYRFFKKHSIMLTNSFSNRKQKDADISKKMNEIRGAIRYSYSF